MKKPWGEGPLAGDLVLIGGFAYALVALKSGLNRADQWHLVPSVLVLATLIVLPTPTRIVPIQPALRRAGIALVAVVALTYSLGQCFQRAYIFIDDGLRPATGRCSAAKTSV